MRMRQVEKLADATWFGSLTGSRWVTIETGSTDPTNQRVMAIGIGVSTTIPLTVILRSTGAGNLKVLKENKVRPDSGRTSFLSMRCG